MEVDTEKAFVLYELYLLDARSQSCTRNVLVQQDARLAVCVSFPASPGQGGGCSD